MQMRCGMRVADCGLRVRTPPAGATVGGLRYVVGGSENGIGLARSRMLAREDGDFWKTSNRVERGKQGNIQRPMSNLKYPLTQGRAYEVEITQ
jgi:hypothetical protein